MKFSEIKDYHEITESNGRKYRWCVENGENLIITAPSTVMNFDHKNLACRVNAIFEMKHYMVYGKKWTEKAGVGYAFVVPKSRIELIEQPGTSFVSIVINGTQFVLNVSGHSTKEGWEDIIRVKTHTCILKTKKQLKALAGAALSPEEVLQAGVGFDAEVKRVKRFFEMAAQPVVLNKLKEGMQVMLGNDCSLRGSQGPFTVKGVNRIRRRIYIENLYAKYSQIDWTATAERNHIEIDIPEAFNRVGKLEVHEGNKYVA